MSNLISGQADRIIAKCDGEDRRRGIAILAELAGISVNRVHRWTYPKSREGTGGLIPTQHHQSILDRARERGIELSPADFFEPEPASEQAA